MEKHLKHLRYLESILAKQENGTPSWWTIKGQLEQVRIAYSQSWNLAVAGLSDEYRSRGIIQEQGGTERLEKLQSYFYDKLTEPLSILINEAKGQIKK